jgi:hypothetical protein
MDNILHPLNLDTLNLDILNLDILNLDISTAKNTNSPARACSPKDFKDKLE